MKTIIPNGYKRIWRTAKPQYGDAWVPHGNQFSDSRSVIPAVYAIEQGNFKANYSSNTIFVRMKKKFAAQKI
jgi:hypothetical protein